MDYCCRSIAFGAKGLIVYTAKSNGVVGRDVRCICPLYDIHGGGNAMRPHSMISFICLPSKKINKAGEPSKLLLMSWGAVIMSICCDGRAIKLLI